MKVSGWVWVALASGALLGCGKSEKENDADDEPAGITDGGTISLGNTEPSALSPEGNSWSGASFWRGAPKPCRVYPDRGCRELARCTPWPDDAPSGAVSITAGSAAPVALPADGKGWLWQPGDTIVIDSQATKDSPAFSTSLAGPSYPVLSEPKPPLMYGVTVDIDRQQPLDLVWNDDAQGTVHLIVSAADIALGGFACSWPASDGHATVPAEFTSLMTPSEAGNHDSYWNFTLTGYNYAVVEADTFEVLVTTTATGSNSSFPAFVR